MCHMAAHSYTYAHKHTHTHTYTHTPAAWIFEALLQNLPLRPSTKRQMKCAWLDFFFICFCFCFCFFWGKWSLGSHALGAQSPSCVSCLTCPVTDALTGWLTERMTLLNWPLPAQTSLSGFWSCASMELRQRAYSRSLSLAKRFSNF